MGQHCTLSATVAEVLHSNDIGSHLQLIRLTKFHHGTFPLMLGAGAVVLEVRVHLHSHRKRTRVGHVDQDLHHIDIGLIALAAGTSPGRLHDRGYKRHGARKLAPSKSLRAYRDPLTYLDFPEISLVELRAHTQG